MARLYYQERPDGRKPKYTPKFVYWRLAAITQAIGILGYVILRLYG